VGEIVGTVTVRFAAPVVFPDAAVIATLPPLTPEAKPVELTVASDVFDDDQVTEAVTFAVLPSV
jgi:hypothetical protein